MFWVLYVFVMVWVGGALVAVQRRRQTEPKSLVTTQKLLTGTIGLMGVYLFINMLWGSAAMTARAL
ncbi:hypothetical protein ACM76A_30255 [Pseudomonas aeruginosa]